MNKNWAQYEYSYNLANSRENWAQKKNSARERVKGKQVEVIPNTSPTHSCCIAHSLVPRPNFRARPADRTRRMCIPASLVPGHNFSTRPQGAREKFGVWGRDYTSCRMHSHMHRSQVSRQCRIKGAVCVNSTMHSSLGQDPLQRGKRVRKLSL